MRPRLLLPLVVAVALLGLVGCKPRPGRSSQPPASSTAAPGSAPVVAPASPPPRAPSPRRTGSALARTVASDALLVADEDHAVLRRVPLPLDPAAPVGETALPGPPAQVLVRDGEVWVTVREPGLLLGFALEGAGLREVARIALPADAWGLGLSPDEKTMLVTSAWTHAVTVVDLEARRVVRTLEVAREPRGVVFAPDGGHAYVTHLVGTALTRVDLGGEQGPRARPVALPAAPLRAPPDAPAPGASLGYAAALSSDGRRLLVPRHALGTYIPVRPDESTFLWEGHTIWFGSATIDVLMLADDRPLVPRRTAGATVLDDQRPAALGPTPPGSNPLPFVQPRDVLPRPGTDTVLVVSEGSDELTEHDARSVDPSLGRIRSYLVGSGYPAWGAGPHVAAAGAAPQGLALSPDGDTAWVFARGTYDLVEVSLDRARCSVLEGRVEMEETCAPAGARVRLGADPLGEQASVGRRLFLGATDDVVSGGLACAGCHPEGRDDGFVWRLAREKPIGPHDEPDTVLVGHPSALVDADGDGHPRQTLMLAGRLGAAGPYGWRGQSDRLEARLLESFHQHRWKRSSHGPDREAPRARPLLAFLTRQGLRPPPRDARPLTAQEEQGRALFLGERTGCATCHPAATGYTTRTPTPLRTPLPTRPGFAPEEGAFQVPSLLHVGGTPPYYHDGSAPTLEALIEQNRDRMGQTSHLTADEKRALVAFLRTL